MPSTILTYVCAALGIALLAAIAYGAVQNTRLKNCKADFAQFRADVESEAAKAKVAAAQEATRRALAAQGVLDDLQNRNAALNARYELLRRTTAGSGTMPSLSSAAQSLGSCPGTDRADASTRFLAEVESRVTAITEAGDREIAKYRELWELQVRNSAI